ncbi:MAG TPA: MBL fold metallo-hydrolase [Candidatus Dormibacteraeota bacterium]|nr:MBL fold metallo-hydrolase [Candidatus Dormibacteraeota bacterium]
MTTTTIIDTQWIGRPHAVASALLRSAEHGALIDPGPASTLETLRAGLRSEGLEVADLDAILLTHIHLDHAGATGALVQENPRLAVYAHTRGAPHLVDPGKLLNSARRLWGDELPRLFGITVPVPAENLRILAGGETLTLDERKLAVEYTPGHAGHHLSYFDESDGTAFVGDTGGIRIQNGPYILPAAPPPDINLELWEESFATILRRRPAKLFLTHFGYAENPAEHLAEFGERLRRWTDAAEQALKNNSDEAAASRAFIAVARAELVAALSESEAEHYAFTAGLDLSFLGLARYLRKRAAAATAPA